LKEILLESRMMRKVSRPVRRKEIGDVLLCRNAPISYPTNGVLFEGTRGLPMVGTGATRSRETVETRGIRGKRI
jgi:hypothetical protein